MATSLQRAVLLHRGPQILHSTLHWNDMNSTNGTHRIFDRIRILCLKRLEPPPAPWLRKKSLSSSHLIFSYFLLNKYQAETCNYDLGSKAYSFLPQTSPDSSRVWVCYLGGYIFCFFLGLYIWYLGVCIWPCLLLASSSCVWICLSLCTAILREIFPLLHCCNLPPCQSTTLLHQH